jgi:vanillate O-demethylase monooxygenase subunit
LRICRKFDKDASNDQILKFKYRFFAEDIEFVETQYPLDLPLNLPDDAHFPADRNSVIDLKVLAGLGPSRQFTA